MKEHHLHNLVQKSDFDRCLLHGLQIVQRKEKWLSDVAPALTMRLQSGAKWSSDVLLDDQKTPYHIICESPGDHHELLELMIKSSQHPVIDAQDLHKKTAVMCAVENSNINCLKCLIANGADVSIGNKRYSTLKAGEIISLSPIMKAMWLLRSASKYSSVIISDMFDLLLDVAVDQNKDHVRSCTDDIQHALLTGNVNCIKRLINVGAPLNVTACANLYVWALIAGLGNVELLKCMFDRGIDKDSIDQNGVSVLEHVLDSGNIEAVRYLLELGVAIPTYAPRVREKQCKQCKENKLIIKDCHKQEDRDPCMRAICEDELELVKLLDEYGSESCKSFIALRCAVILGHEDVVSYLLNNYTYPLNIEYITKDFSKKTFTLLTEPGPWRTDKIIKLLLDHGADPDKQICSKRSASAMMTAIVDGNLKIIAQYIRSGVNINVRSYDHFRKVFPFEASVVRGNYKVAEMLLISGSCRGVFSSFKANPNSRLGKLLKEWNGYDNKVTPLRLRCRSAILNYLSPRADMKIEKLPLPPCLIKFLIIPELDNIA